MLVIILNLPLQSLTDLTQLQWGDTQEMIVLFLALRLWSCENIQYNIWNKLQGSAESEYKQAFCLFIFYLCHFRQQSLAMAQSQVSEKAALCFHCHLSQAYQQQHHLLLSRYVVCLYTNFWNDPFLYLTNVPFSCTFTWYIIFLGWNVGS